MSHLKYMLLGGAGLFGVLLLFGLRLQSALILAVALACLLMMVFMMGGSHSGHTMDQAPRDHQDQRVRRGEQRPSSDFHRHR